LGFSIPTRRLLGDDLALCRNVVVLSLAGHQVRDFDALKHLECLRVLNMSYMSLRDLDEFPSQALSDRLERWDLRGNYFYDTKLERLVDKCLCPLVVLEYLWFQDPPESVRDSDELYHELRVELLDVIKDTDKGEDGAKRSDHFRDIRRPYNPICKAPEYFRAITQAVPSLIHFDGEDLRLRRACGELQDPPPIDSLPVQVEMWLPQWRNRYNKIIPYAQCFDADGNSTYSNAKRPEYDRLRKYDIPEAADVLLKELEGDMQRLRDEVLLAEMVQKEKQR